MPSFAFVAKSAETLPASSRQIVAVVSNDWNSPTAQLRRYSRGSADSPWLEVGGAIPVLVGKNGMAWADGLRKVPNHAGPHKVEGDRRSPAGMFRLTGVFSQKKMSGVRMPSILVTATTEAIDDPRWIYYNQIVDRRRIAHPDWRSSERMAGIKDYALGIVVGANPTRQPGAGSCIFIHQWTGTRKGTSGCTILHRADLSTLVRWLDPAQMPVLIQEPAIEYEARDLEFP